MQSLGYSMARGVMHCLEVDQANPQRRCWQFNILQEEKGCSIHWCWRRRWRGRLLSRSQIRRSLRRSRHRSCLDNLRECCIVVPFWASYFCPMQRPSSFNRSESKSSCLFGCLLLPLYQTDKLNIQPRARTTWDTLVLTESCFMAEVDGTVHRSTKRQSPSFPWY
jgi:hypothetical protein